MPQTILLCDDEVHILRAAEFKFRRAGFDVVCAEDGEDAWEKIKERRPDILITDCQMPRLDGVGLIRRLAGDPETAGIPVVILSAKGFELDFEQLHRDYGVVDLVAKPFSPRGLLKRVEQIAIDTAARHSASASG